MKAQQAVRLAWQHHTIVPAFNIPYLPMAKPVAQAIIDEKTVAMLQVARLEWEKFEAQSLEAVAEEYFKYYDPKYTLLHLDHVPVIDEDQKRVDYMPILERAVKAGYQSVMVDGSRLSLAENIAVTKQVADFAHANDIACEASSAPSWVTRAQVRTWIMKRFSARRRALPISERRSSLRKRRSATG